MNRHAYLIMAFNHFDLLKKLIILLDDKRNDIFIHVDIKSEDFDESYFKNVTKYSNVYFIKRKAVFWADYSMIDVELDLLTNACKTDKYKYYHLISGCDLPLKTQNEIHEFMDGNDYEYLGIYPKEVWYSVRRVKFYHNFTHLKSYRKNKFLKGIDLGIEYLQKFTGVNRLKNKNIKIIDGYQWFSITDDFARYLIEKRDFIEETFRKTIAPDELVVHTMCYNSKFFDRVYNTETKQKGSLRHIDFNRGKPYVFRKDDFDELINESGEAIFARKFDPDVDEEIIDEIFNYINSKQKDEEELV